MDDLTLTVRAAQPATGGAVTVRPGRIISGWTSVRVSRGIERVPSDFEVTLTERYPGEASALVVQPGDRCEVRIGEDLVITGYVDRVLSSISAGSHSITVQGRSRCADLVDCSAEWPNGQISGSSALGIAQKLAAVYGISVKGATDTGQVIPQFSLMYGETAWEVIERTCRYRALLAFDDVAGNLVLSAVGTARAACGFTQGVNVQSASMQFSQDQRYSDYVITRNNTDTFQDAGNGGFVAASSADKGVLRHRLKYIVAEAAYGGTDVAKKRADWEQARRYGRSTALSVETDSWRDSADALWTPNTLVDISIPALKVDGVTWLISSVTYRRGERGTFADLLIMPPAAFVPQPIAPPAIQDVPVGAGAR